MRFIILVLPFCFMTLSFVAVAAVILEISIKNEIDMKDGSYIAKEYRGQGRYAIINHDHGRFESVDGDIVNAECFEGYVVSKLPSRFSKISKFLKQTDFVFTKCNEV